MVCGRILLRRYLRLSVSGLYIRLRAPDKTLSDPCIASRSGITPAAGYVGAPSSLAIGIVTAAACNFATKLKGTFGYDDAVSQD